MNPSKLSSHSVIESKILSGLVASVETFEDNIWCYSDENIYIIEDKNKLVVSTSSSGCMENDHQFHRRMSMPIKSCGRAPGSNPSSWLSLSRTERALES